MRNATTIGRSSLLNLRLVVNESMLRTRTTARISAIGRGCERLPQVLMNALQSLVGESAPSIVLYRGE